MKRTAPLLVSVALAALACDEAPESLTTFSGLTVASVYQVDTKDTTAFDFSASPPHECGGDLYRVYSRSAEAAARKFALVLKALETGWPLSVHLWEGCDHNRAKVGWVRLHRD